MNLPHVLVDEVRAGRCILFTGAGASFGANHPQGRKPPSGTDLGKLIADKFLGAGFDMYPLARIAELAASESSVLKLQTYIRDLFVDFAPANFHRLIPRFVWRAIATTNYDLVLEQSYEDPNRLQSLVPFTRDGQSVESRMRDPDALQYLKLHGSIGEFEDTSCPLILTIDQYVTHRRCRTRLFARLIDLMWESPVIFAGYSLTDPDLRQILIELDSLGANRPRNYLVAPGVSPIEQRHYERSQITVLDGGFEEFMRALDAAIPASVRKLALGSASAVQAPILARLKVRSAQDLSHGLSASLASDVEFVHATMAYGPLNAQAFYRGYFPDWGPIVAGLDVRRRLVEQVMAEVILADESERFRQQELFVIKGHAGSGKTVVLRRIAYEAASQYDALCLFARDGGNLLPETFAELSRLAGARIFLFVDGAAELVADLDRLLQAARRDNVQLTIIASERHSEWNSWCTSLEIHQTGEGEVRYLSQGEIDELLVLLERYKSLGYLSTLSAAARRAELAQRAGRQLLVALHEATMGEPFEKIIVDEFNALPVGEVRSLYLTVCVLHRLDVPTRAGLISRVHGIPFNEFQTRLFKPLEFIVFAENDRRWRDVVYRTRHSHIAQIVVENILEKAEERFDEYARLIDALDPDYSSDREALRQLLAARRLLGEFPDAAMGRQLFGFAFKRLPDDATIFQQAAIFEMLVTSGNLGTAQTYLDRATELQPSNRAFRHSRAELLLRRSANARTELEKLKLRASARAICADLITSGEQQSYPYHTLLKILLDELEEVIASHDDSTVQAKVRDVETAVNVAMQRFPGEQFLRESESRFAALIGNHERSLAALRKAFEANPRTPFIALRLAKTYERAGDANKAIEVLKKSLEFNPGEKDLNLTLGSLLESTSATMAEVLHHRRRSFTKGDGRFEAQFWYARALYLDGKRAEADKEFQSLRAANVAPEIRDRVRGFVESEGSRKRYTGSVVRLEAGYALVEAEHSSDRVFAPRRTTAAVDFDRLHWRDTVTFELGFNFRGPVACGLAPRPR